MSLNLNNLTLTTPICEVKCIVIQYSSDVATPTLYICVYVRVGVSFTQQGFGTTVLQVKVKPHPLIITIIMLCRMGQGAYYGEKKIPSKDAAI